MSEGNVYVDLGPVLRAVETVNSNLHVINSNIEMVNGRVDQVDGHVSIVEDEVGKLANDFHEFVRKQLMANRLHSAEIDIVRIRQELDQKYGHYETVRRHTTGILQATDLEIIRSSTIMQVTEELMLDAPNYWLAPCLVALSAWISDQPALAERALREGIRRNDEKTSLLFALICRRADRKEASLKWTRRYLENQDEERLDRKAVVVLDAFASGLLGADAEGVVGKQIDEWMDHLSQKPGFVEQQTTQWSDAINLKRRPISDSGYIYLKKYSPTWGALSGVMEGAYLHAIILRYFEGIFEQESSTEAIKAQLDEIMNSLVTDFDDEELPLRMEEKMESLVIKYKGDESRAGSDMAVERSAFQTHKDFTQLLTDAAMKPESSHASVSTQKFAIALSRDWIANAYNDVVAKNRMAIPNVVQIILENFNETTADGRNEGELIEKFTNMVEEEKEQALEQAVLTGFEKFCLYGGIAFGVIGLIALPFTAFLGVISILAGIGMIINHFSKKKKLEIRRQNILDHFAQRLKAGTEIIRATLAEVVDFRAEFTQKDSESQMVTDFLDQISPDQYIRRVSGSNRRIKMVP